MRIGIDIDGVLTDVERFSVDYLSKFCVENNIEYSIGKSDYDVSKTFGISSQQADAFWDKYIEYYAENEKPREFASEVLKKLQKDGHEIYIITARWRTNRDDEAGERMRNLVKEWLNKNDIVYDKLIFSKALKEKKLQEVRETKIDIMIEDSPKNINDISAIVPVICFDTSYNKTCEGDNIIRCYSWYDVYRIIRGFEGGKI